MEITIPVTIKHPDFTVTTPFGSNIVQGSTEQLTITLHLDDEAQATIKALVK